MKTKTYNEADLLAELKDLTNIKIDVVPAKIINEQLLVFFCKVIIYFCIVGSILLLLVNKYYVVDDFLPPFAPWIPLGMDLGEIGMLCYLAWNYLFYKHAILVNFKHGDILINKLNRILKYAACIHAILWIGFTLIFLGSEPNTVFGVFFAVGVVVMVVTGFVIGLEVKRLGFSSCLTGLQNIVKNRHGVNQTINITDFTQD